MSPGFPFTMTLYSGAGLMSSSYMGPPPWGGFGDEFVVNADQTLVNVHLPTVCVAPCVIHAPSDHHMRSWPLVWDEKDCLFLRVCPHGVRHPDPDSRDPIMPTHACCSLRCCVPPDIASISRIAPFFPLG